MTVLFLDVAFDQCRTPRWTDATPILERMVCGEPAIPGRTYCAACREVLIAGVMKDGREVWFVPTVGWQPGKRAAPHVVVDETESILNGPDLGADEIDGAEMDEAADDEAQPDGDQALQPSDLCDWGMAA